MIDANDLSIYNRLGDAKLACLCMFFALRLSRQNSDTYFVYGFIGIAI